MTASCATVKAVIEAPTEFWLTLERILSALWTDIQSALLLVGI